MHLTVTTLTGSIYELRRADNVAGQPVTLRHRRDAYTPPEVLIGGGAWVNCPAGFALKFCHDAVRLIAPGVLAHSSPVVDVVVDGGVRIPILDPVHA